MQTIDIIRYKATIAYDGTEFSGFQIQPNGRTVQGEIETVLQTINKDQFIRIHPSGRTDAGVHAAGMVFHFDFPVSIPRDGVFKAMNVLLPPDIALLSLKPTEADFHARYHALAKTYTYRVHNHKIRDPFTHRFALHHPYEMDEVRAQEAVQQFLGTHDFTSFCSTKTVIENKVRTIYEAKVSVDKVANEWVFTFTGNGFLYNMVRIMVGTLIEVADGRREVEAIPEMFAAQDRGLTGKTIAARGLRLEKVYYDEEELKQRFL